MVKLPKKIVGFAARAAGGPAQAGAMAFPALQSLWDMLPKAPQTEVELDVAPPVVPYYVKLHQQTAQRKREMEKRLQIKPASPNLTVEKPAKFDPHETLRALSLPQEEMERWRKLRQENEIQIMKLRGY